MLLFRPLSSHNITTISRPAIFGNAFWSVQNAPRKTSLGFLLWSHCTCPCPRTVDTYSWLLVFSLQQLYLSRLLFLATPKTFITTLENICSDFPTYVLSILKKQQAFIRRTLPKFIYKATVCLFLKFLLNFHFCYRKSGNHWHHGQAVVKVTC